MDGIDLGLYPRPQLCPLDLTTNYGLLWSPCLHCGASLESFSQAVATSHPTPPPSPPADPPPQLCWPKIGAYFHKNDLKWPIIKQVTILTYVYYIY